MQDLIDQLQKMNEKIESRNNEMKEMIEEAELIYGINPCTDTGDSAPQLNWKKSRLIF